MQNKDKDENPHLLVIVLDTNPSQRLLRRNPQVLSRCVESAIALGNAHIMQNRKNRLAFLACHHTGSEFLYPSPSTKLKVRRVDSQYELFSKVERTIKYRLSQIIQNASKLNAPCESLLAGGIAMAMCYITRLQRQMPPGTQLHSRILIVSGSAECASQYMSYMNVFFTAHKQGIVLDVCALDSGLTLLQQGADITGGQYLRLTQLDGLMQYFMWVFLPDPQMREKLVLPPAAKVDYRAACFCHRELIDVGYVCSVCLSIFCKFSPLCTTCQSIFKLPPLVPLRTKKRIKSP